MGTPEKPFPFFLEVNGEMSRVEKYNPLKSSTLSRKKSALKDGRKGKAEIQEITYESVKEDAVRFGLATDVLYQMNAGKEASIFLADWNNHPIVLKAYRMWQSSHKISKKKGFHVPASSKRTYCVLDMMESFAVVEFDLLEKCFHAGIPVPTPIGRVGNYLTMRFIGDEMEPAPQLKDVHLANPEAVLDQILDDYLIMYRDVHYIHGDLSRYNILWWKERGWFIDVPQAYEVGPWCDMNKAERMLLRDIRNVLSYFESYDMYKDPKHILEVFLSEYTPSNQKHYRELAQDNAELL